VIGEHVAEIIPFQPSTQHAGAASRHVHGESFLTTAVYAVFSSAKDTLIAANVGHRLATALQVPLTIVHFQTVPYSVPLDRPADLSPAETETFVTELRTAGIDADVRVLLCRDPARSLAAAFDGPSLVVLAGPRSRWPRRSASARMRLLLEAAGHVVVFVDTSASYAAIGTAGGESKEDVHA
jgi:hypothetical protein